MISVSFTSQVTLLASFSALVEDPNVETLILGDSLYAPQSGDVHVIYQTKTSWPFVIDSSTTEEWKSKLGLDEESISFSVKPYPAMPTVCTFEAGSSCLQYWIATVNVGSGQACVTDIQGSFHLSADLKCRDISIGFGSCGTDAIAVPYQLIAGPTSLCDSSAEQILVKAQTAVVTFSDPDLATESDVFLTGEFVFAAFRVWDSPSTIDSITFDTVAFYSDVEAVSVLYDTESGWDKRVFKFQEVSAPVAPHGEAQVTLAFPLVRDFNALSVLWEDDTQEFTSLTLEISVNIAYHGNDVIEKRSVSVPVQSKIGASKSGKGTEEVGTKNFRVSLHPDEKVSKPENVITKNAWDFAEVSQNGAPRLFGSALLVLVISFFVLC